jgi:hypothetical protein
VVLKTESIFSKSVKRKTQGHIQKVYNLHTKYIITKMKTENLLPPVGPLYLPEIRCQTELTRNLNKKETDLSTLQLPAMLEKEQCANFLPSAYR